MKEKGRSLRIVNLILGFVSLAFFVLVAYVILRLQPRMVEFQTLSFLEESLITWTGVGLLILLLYFAFSTLQLIQFLRPSEKVKWINILLLIFGVVAGLLVFSDVALFSDIHKQYQEGLSQPEWALLYPIIGFQWITWLIFMYFHLSKKCVIKADKRIARDANIYVVVQYVGLICGLMGLSMMSLGFFFPGGWNLLVHTLITSAILILPYLLALGYWVIAKLHEKDRQWFDEMQSQDVGKSAFITMVAMVVLLFGIFVFDLNHPESIVRMLWFPIYLFGTLFTFSLGNLFYSSRG